MNEQQKFIRTAAENTNPWLPGMGPQERAFPVEREECAKEIRSDMDKQAENKMWPTAIDAPMPWLPLEVASDVGTGVAKTLKNLTDLIGVQRATISAQEGTIKRLQKELSELNKWIHSHI